MYYNNSMFGFGGPGWFPLFGPIVLVLALWSIFWKGLAFWHSAQRGQYWWFIIMLFVNTLGILEIIYLFGVAKLKFDTLFSSNHHSHHS